MMNSRERRLSLWSNATCATLHGVLGCAVKRNPVDHSADHDTALHELADGLTDVLIVATKAVDPANYERVARSQEIEEPPPLSPLSELGADQRTQAEKAGFKLDKVVCDEGVSGVAGRLGRSSNPSRCYKGSTETMRLHHTCCRSPAATRRPHPQRLDVHSVHGLVRS
jgi:hypothetical protein